MISDIIMLVITIIMIPIHITNAYHAFSHPRWNICVRMLLGFLCVFCASASGMLVIYYIYNLCGV